MKMQNIIDAVALLEDSSLDDKIETLISKCNFDEYDLDIGTSGLCGTFALALYNILHKRNIPAQLILLCVADGNKPLLDKDGRYYWRHVMVKVGNSYFDVEGKVDLEDAIQNYVWGYIKGTGGMPVPISYSDLVKELRIMRRSSFDGEHLSRWKNTIRKN